MIALGIALGLLALIIGARVVRDVLKPLPSHRQSGFTGEEGQ